MTDLRKAAEMALDALERITRQFTKTPSSLKDSEARCEAHKAMAELRQALAQPEQAAVPFPSFMRKRIEEAMDLAIKPKGMSVHVGKAKVLVSDLHRMLLVIDSTSPRKEEKSDAI